MKCIFASYTNIGGRSNNEDAFLAMEKDGSYLLAVADGLGGHEYGEVASKAAVDAMKTAFANENGFDMRSALDQANVAVFGEQKKAGKQMHTTLACVYASGNELVLGHAGDTRIYLFFKDGTFSRTVDHSASQIAVMAGEITPEQIRQHEDRNVLTKVLGGFENLRPEIAVIDAAKVEAVLICSDGFWEYVLEPEMTGTLKRAGTPKKWLNLMRDFIRKRAPKNNDNNTAVAAFVK